MALGSHRERLEVIIALRFRPVQNGQNFHPTPSSIFSDGQPGTEDSGGNWPYAHSAATIGALGKNSVADDQRAGPFVEASMKYIAVLLLIFTASSSSAETCKYGLGTTYGTETCSSRETEALLRVLAAKTICMSGNTSLHWNKNSKEPSWAWAAINSGESTAVKDFALRSCGHADLVVKYEYDDASETVTINVTDAESSATVFEENRRVSDLDSDSVRMANHWREMVFDARSAARAAKAAVDEAEHERERQAKMEQDAVLCQGEFSSLKQNIIDYLEVQHASLPQTVLGRIEAHNERCPNKINSEIVLEEEKADAEAKLAQQEAEKEKALQERRTAELAKAKVDALAAWRQQIASAPFVPPVEGWMDATALPNTSSYIILPGSGLTSNCHFTTDNSKPALDCLGSPGRNDYFSVQSNGRWYLLKSKWTASGDYAGTVKDNGSTICLRKAGCYRVLAEARPDPTELPDKIDVPSPGILTSVYSNDAFSFSYPQNWRADEIKNKENTLVQVNVAPPEGHLASWVTHGFFVGRVTKMPSGFPPTLDGAFDQFTKFEKQRGLAITDAKSVAPVGDSLGRIVTYTSPSVLNAGEVGWIALVKDKNDGYYWIVMFYPQNDDSQLYAKTFDNVLRSFKFKK